MPINGMLAASAMALMRALRCEYIELDFDPDGRWAVRWGAIPLGTLDEHAPERGLIVKRRQRGEAAVTGQSYVGP